jgi:hypothetical protein
MLDVLLFVLALAAVLVLICLPQIIWPPRDPIN